MPVLSKVKKIYSDKLVIKEFLKKYEFNHITQGFSSNH